MNSGTIAETQPILRIQLLGDFHLTYGGEAYTGIASPRLQALLAYLLLHRGIPQPRQYLAFTFWPDLPENHARNNLRQALFQIRQALPNKNSFLETDAMEVFWRLDSPFTLDVAEFEQALKAADVAEKSGNQRALLSEFEHALTLYRKELLPSCYDNWILPERERLHLMSVAAHERIILLLEGQRDYPAAIRFAQQLIRFDPLYESGYRLLIRLFALNKDRANALRTYQTCVEVLKRELGVGPEPATRQVYDLLLGENPQGFEHPQDPMLVLPLVGRRDIWAQILAVWSRAAAGDPHFLLLIGEAGIGKTRLCEELLDWAAKQGISTAKTRAYAAEGWLAFDPIVDWLRSDACKKAISRLEKVWRTELSRLLPELLTETPDLLPPEPLVEFWQRQKFFQALAQGILGARQPLLLVIDDLQWCDPDTLEWLHYFLRAILKAQILLVGTARVEDIVSNKPLSGLLADLRRNGLATEISIPPLDASETSQLAGQTLGLGVNPDVSLALYQETEGNPLFILEAVRSGFRLEELGSGTLLGDENSNGIPRDDPERLLPKMRAIIASRIASLSPPARELVTFAAAAGRAFTFPLLAEASGINDDNLGHSVEELWQRRIICEQGDNTFDFSHDKIRDVAYAEISPPRRPLIHSRIAQALEKLHATDLDTVSGQLAVHYERAGVAEKAITYYHRAATVVQRLGANREAFRLMEKALKILDAQIEVPKHTRLEIDLQKALDVNLDSIKSYNARETIHAYYLAQALSQRLGPANSSMVLHALALAYNARTKFVQSLGFGAQLLNQSKQQSNTLLEVEAHFIIGVALFWFGAFEQSRVHLAEAIRLYQPEQSQTHIQLYTQDARLTCMSRLGFDLDCLGYPAQAIQISQEAMDYGEKLGHPHSLGYAMFWDALLYNDLGRFADAENKAKALVDLSHKFQLAQWHPFGIIMQGWATAELDELNLGIGMIREGLKELQSFGFELLQAFFISLLAEQAGKAGEVDQSISLLGGTLAKLDRTGECWCEAELHRRLGELYLRRDDEAGAEKEFQRALQVAQSQGARMFELRAAVRLSHLWCMQDKSQQAFQFLEPIYDGFQEGLDLPDFIAARKIIKSI
ncbi:MAG: AAA family ATPase [Chloroflexi bacterium]|nr:AAA family ATPase [Chloroflexota bacterium]